MHFTAGLFVTVARWLGPLQHTKKPLTLKIHKNKRLHSDVPKAVLYWLANNLPAHKDFYFMYLRLPASCPLQAQTIWRAYEIDAGRIPEIQ